MSWGEAWRMLGVLGNDPSSCIAAAMAGWSHPVDYASLVLMDLFDLQYASKAEKKPKPYPRPWPMKNKSTTKPHRDLTQDEIIAALRAAGHTARLPGEPEPAKGRHRDAQGRFVKVSD